MPILSSIASIQVAEALKLLTGDRRKLQGSLMQIDVWENEWRKIRLAEPDSDCVACAHRKFEFLDAEAHEFSAVLCGRNAVQVAPSRRVSLDLALLRDRLAPFNDVKQNEYLLRFSPDVYEMTVFTDGRAIVKGTDDISVARSLYAKYIGT
jgi:adenylyltransferase/sulfurtransferase